LKQRGTGNALPAELLRLQSPVKSYRNMGKLQ